MNFSGINFCDTANGPGCRVSLFVSGCTNRCKGCFSTNTWDFDAGELFTRKQMKEILDKSAPGYIRGLSILGGEPMHPKNSPIVLDIVNEYRERFGESKDIWIWTGYEFEYLYRPLLDSGGVTNEFIDRGYTDYPEWIVDKSIIDKTDVFVCGRFEEDKKDLTLPYRGSSNQYLVFSDRDKHPSEFCKTSDATIIQKQIEKTGLG